ncbi:MAG TPA: fumarylacetoacetate hydrolase family protein [Planctomycetia bacterium]|nr:fumarylacetoacetate hydrolase family protein [Planctomycetia bacterium]
MRLVTFSVGKWGPRLGARRADGAIVDLGASEPSLPRTMRQLLEAGEPALETARWAAEKPGSITVENATLLAPVLDPQKIVCVGLNYRDHANETKSPIPREPVIFNKFPTALAGPEATIPLPAESTEVDYEAELVAVIGRSVRRCTAAEGLAAIAGYCCGHDVSARDWQKNKDGKQWLLGKSFDGFAPLGPELVTADEVGDAQNLGIRFRLNGETMQESNTSQMIFSLGDLVAYVSQVCTLHAGDLLFTGTPAGVGVARSPQVFLQPGDLCEVEIDGLGVLRNRCVGDGKPISG